jgi:hypothetical protein
LAVNSKVPQIDVPIRSAPVTGSKISFILPSVSDVIFIVLLVSLTCTSLSQRLLGDAGIGWHIRNGEVMVQNHAITRTDPFSSTMSGRPWYAWEWLYDVPMGRIHSWLGLNGVVLVTAVLIAAAFGVAFHWIVVAGGGLPVTTVLILLSISASTIHFFARPHVVSWIFVLLWFLILDSVEKNPLRSARLFWLPALMPLWANLHGGFLTGFVLSGCYLVAGLVSGPTVRNRRYLRTLAAATVLSAITSLLNPFGYGLYVHIYGYLSNQFLMNHIDEFLSPNFHGIAQQCFLILLLISVAVLAVRRENLRPSRFLLLMFAAFSGLYSSRNLPVSSILLTAIIAPVLSRTIAATAENPSVLPWLRRAMGGYDAFALRMSEMEVGLRGHLWPALALLLLFIAALHDGRLGSRVVIHAQFDGRRFPIQAVDRIASAANPEPIFCPDYWGGYLVYRLYPQTKVVVDDRHDLYGEEFFREYLKTVRGEPGWDLLLDRNHVRRVLAPSESALSNLLKEFPEWTVSYEDKVAVLFEKK